MLDEAMKAVEDFHKSKNIDFKQRLADCPEDDRMPMLDEVIARMKFSSGRALTYFKHSPEPKDYRYLRTSLLLEELAEAFEALQERDEVKLLDALCDLIYVAVGAAITYDLPLSEAFREVQYSNMTKRVSPGAADPRLGHKGDAYQSPNLEAILCRHRDTNQ